MIVKMPGRQVMPHSYCNDRRKYIHLQRHVLKTDRRGGISFINKYFNRSVNGEYCEVQTLDHKLMDIFYEIGRLSPTDKQQVIEIYLKTGWINWRILHD